MTAKLYIGVFMLLAGTLYSCQKDEEVNKLDADYWYPARRSFILTIMIRKRISVSSGHIIWQTVFCLSDKIKYYNILTNLEHLSP